MKYVIIILSLVFLSCATVPETIKPLNISTDEVLESELLYSFPMTPWHIMGFSMLQLDEFTEIAIAFILFTSDNTIVRYCYLDQGKLVGFEVDIDVFNETREVVYKLQDINEEEFEVMTRALNRIESGLEPYDLEEEDEVSLGV